MTQKEVTNIIIKLRKEGWSDKKISNFIGYIETHDPTDEEKRVFEESDDE